MFRSFAVIAEILLLVFLLQSPFVHYFLADVHHTLSNAMLALSQWADKRELEQVKLQLASTKAAMRPYQKDYVDNIFSSQDNVRHFHQTYCEGGDKNPFVYGATLRLVCNQISQSDILSPR